MPPTNSPYDKSDGCDGGIEWYYRRFKKKESPHKFCCDLHDYEYACGGFNPINRWKADWRFLKCIWSKKSLKTQLSAIFVYYLPVVLFGWFSFYFIKAYYILRKKMKK